MRNFHLIFDSQSLPQANLVSSQELGAMIPMEPNFQGLLPLPDPILSSWHHANSLRRSASTSIPFGRRVAGLFPSRLPGEKHSGLSLNSSKIQKLDKVN